MQNNTVFAVFNTRHKKYLMRGSSQSPRLYFSKSQAISCAKTFVDDLNRMIKWRQNPDPKISLVDEIKSFERTSLEDIEIREFELGPYKATKLV